MKRLIPMVFIPMFCISNFSCKRVVMRFAGINMPAVESRQSIQDFLLGAGEDTSRTYALDSALFMRMQQTPYKPGWDSSFRPFQIRVYDGNGHPVMQWSSCEGLLKELNTFDSVPPKNANGLNTDLTLKQDLSQYFTLDGMKTSIEIPQGADYYMVIYFAKWYPKMSRSMFHHVRKYILEHPELKIHVYKVVVDVMDFWQVETVFTLY